MQNHPEVEYRNAVLSVRGCQDGICNDNALIPPCAHRRRAQRFQAGPAAGGGRPSQDGPCLGEGAAAHRQVRRVAPRRPGAGVGAAGLVARAQGQAAGPPDPKSTAPVQRPHPPRKGGNQARAGQGAGSASPLAPRPDWRRVPIRRSARDGRQPAPWPHVCRARGRGGRAFLQARVAIHNAVSIMRLEKPHSLSYQLTTRTMPPSVTVVCAAATVEECGSWLKSTETSGASS
jgi:hypothetical protein